MISQRRIRRTRPPFRCPRCSAPFMRDGDTECDVCLIVDGHQSLVGAAPVDDTRPGAVDHAIYVQPPIAAGFATPEEFRTREDWELPWLAEVRP